ncbi:MAG: amidohydrolase family protein [Kordiimonas sp.]
MKKFLILTFKALSALIGLALVYFIAGILWPLSTATPNTRPQSTLIKNVSIIDVTTGNTLPSQDILVNEGTIAQIGTNLPSSDAFVVHGQGKYVIPGLIDMHAHSIKLSPYIMHPMMVAAGVTTVRDMNGCIGEADAWVACADEKRAWHQAVSAGDMVSPHYDKITGLAINGGSEIPDTLDSALGGATPEGARARVTFAKQRGLDFLKPYSEIPREGYFELAKAAGEQDLYLAGHLPFRVSAFEAIEAGQRSIEHAMLFVWECFPEMTSLRESSDIRSVYTNELRMRMIKEHDTKRCSALHQAMKQQGTAFVPTHTTRKLDAYALDENYRNDARLKYIPAPLRMLWLQDADGMARRAGEGAAESFQAFYEFGIEQTGIAHKAGVPIFVGTDTPDSFAFPGSGMHDELDHFIKAGLNPLEALQAATIKPAHFLGLSGQAGEITSGARADLVFLSENPLNDIRALRNIEAVMLAGNHYDRVALDGFETIVVRNANHWSMWPKFVWQMINSPIMHKQFAD